MALAEVQLPDEKHESTSLRPVQESPMPDAPEPLLRARSEQPQTANSSIVFQRPITPQPVSNANRSSWHAKGNSTPSMRTGPPRSLSYNYSPSHSPLTSRKNSRNEPDIPLPPGVEMDENLHIPSSAFRGVLESLGSTPGSSPVDKKGKRRETRFVDEPWNPIRWFQESPRDERDGFDLHPKSESSPPAPGSGASTPKTSTPKVPSKVPLTLQTPVERAEKRPNSAKWGRLKALLPNVTGEKEKASPSGLAVVAQPSVNITDELIAGGLSTLMLRLWFERDEKGHRRIPVLFHRLRIRVSDSLHPTKRRKAVFRIECEYANGAARWVIYRDLRDFLSLHGHFTIANTYSRKPDDLPEFPKMSLPYFKFLNRERHDKDFHADFARQQRELLENYLINLIRAVMFHPSTNRLASFFEMSALSISLAQSGGTQYKAGFLQIEAANDSGFGRKSANWSERRQVRWAAVRESYFVVLNEPGEHDVWDVFMLDPDFAIERPNRYYRRGLKLLQHEHGVGSVSALAHGRSRSEPQTHHSENGDISRRAAIRQTFRKILHPRHTTSPSAFPYDDTATVSSSASSSTATRPSTPLLDPSTHVNPIIPENADTTHEEAEDRAEEAPWNQDKKKVKSGNSRHTFFIVNSQLRLKLYARNKRQMDQFITAFEKAAAMSHYASKNRFDSFAPIRLNVSAQWLVDGRDYFWNLSRAILLARESVYIHDWWISPELQMRRPKKRHYRLDHLLERKAKEGVKIYIIVYQEVSNRTTPTDSNYAKQRLTSLHPNIMVQRSPSHFQTGTFYWAHHEKLCVIDQTIAFMGGLDLCFGRWDTPQHALSDEAEDNEDQIWPGKDYSNPRVLDFLELNKPFDDMYDRSKVPRMPWHDVGLQIVGQPARDLCRHFVQRWNWLLRIKNHTREMPFLIPPPEFRPGELTQQSLTGTCDLQICRSAGPWSLGTPSRVECSIQNAYLKVIQMSEHFVYIENQFFISSTEVEDVKIENKIGDALVHRILRAHRDRTPWKCCIVIPLIPGFTYPVDHSDASAVRLILEAQNCTISRGASSIFARLKKEGIDPDDYITFFSLRNWAKLSNDTLTTEQVYIHGKVCIVDDRLAIIGSANINERSQRGDRDSEIAAVIRDTDMIDGTMAGRPFKVGRFAHSLRVRLMREHIGVNVDEITEENLLARDPVKPADEQQLWDPDHEQHLGQGGVTTEVAPGASLSSTVSNTVNHVSGGVSNIVDRAVNKSTKSTEKTSTGDKDTFNPYFASATIPHDDEGSAAAPLPTIEEKLIMERRSRTPEGIPLPISPDFPSPGRSEHAIASERRDGSVEEGTPLRRRFNSRIGSRRWAVPIRRPEIDSNRFEDPISDFFWKDMWLASAIHNTEIYRKVFHAIPDDLVLNWKQYKDFVAHHERLAKPPRDSPHSDSIGRTNMENGVESSPPSRAGDTLPTSFEEPRHSKEDTLDPESSMARSESRASLDRATSRNKRSLSRGVEPFERWEREEMENLLSELNGHLVIFPTRFLEDEDRANNFLFNADKLHPLPIYD